MEQYKHHKRLHAKTTQSALIYNCVKDLKELARYTKRLKDPNDQPMLDEMYTFVCILYGEMDRVNAEYNSLIRCQPPYE